jgi:hypothetical protein
VAGREGVEAGVGCRDGRDHRLTVGDRDRSVEVDRRQFGERRDPIGAAGADSDEAAGLGLAIGNRDGGVEVPCGEGVERGRVGEGRQAPVAARAAAAKADVINVFMRSFLSCCWRIGRHAFSGSSGSLRRSWKRLAFPDLHYETWRLLFRRSRPRVVEGHYAIKC